MDSNSGRKKGVCGENKILYILKKYGFQEIKTWNEFFGKDNVVVRFSKTFSVKNVRKNLNIKLSAKKQNKKLDLIIKRGKEIFLCEAKHLNTTGGAQDKQISELIEIISLKEKNKDIHYIAFLDGVYSNILLGNEKNGSKLKIQQKEIDKFLSCNANNFWVNTFGFESLFAELISGDIVI